MKSALFAIVRKKLYSISCSIVLIQDSFGELSKYISLNINKPANPTYPTRCASWCHHFKMHLIKLSVNYWKIVSVGLQKERSSSDYVRLSNKSKYQI